jgi:O-antigen ligase
MTALRRRLPEQLLRRGIYPKHILRLIVVPAVLFLAYYLGRRPNLDYAVVPMAAVAAYLLLRRPVLGVVAIIPAALLVRYGLGTGTGTALNVAFLMVPGLLGIWLVRQMLNGSVSLRPARMNAPLVGLVLTATISLISGYLPWVVFAQQAPIRAQVGALGVFAVSAGAYFLAANVIEEERWLKYMTAGFLAAGSAYVASLMVPGLGFLYGYFQFGANGSMFFTWLVALALGQAQFNSNLKSWQRLLLGGVAAATVLLLFTGEFRSWASGWVPAVCAVGVLVFLRWPWLGTVVAAAALIGTAVYWGPIQSFLLEGNQYSLLTRSAAIDIVLEIIRANPLLGVGPANYYYYTPLYAILGWYVRFNSHNQYVDLVAQTGLLGLFFFGWFAVAAVVTGWKLRARRLSGFATGYVSACLAGIAGMIVAGALGDWFLPFVYNIGIAGFRSSVLPWLFVGGLVAIESLSNTAERPAPAA